MKLFHGYTNISNIEIKKGLFKATEISCRNLRGKRIIIPAEFKRYIRNKFSKWVNEAMNYNNYPTVKKVMFTVAMNEKYMVISLQHPLDTGKKKDGNRKAKAKLKRMTKNYNKEKRPPKWVLKL